MGRAGASWRLLGGRESLRAEHHAPGGLVRAVSHLRPDGGPRLVAGPSRSSATGQPDGSPSRCDYQGGPPARAHLRLPLPSYRGRCVAPENPSRRPAHHAPHSLGSRPQRCLQALLSRARRLASLPPCHRHGPQLHPGRPGRIPGNLLPRPPSKSSAGSAAPASLLRGLPPSPSSLLTSRSIHLLRPWADQPQYPL